MKDTVALPKSNAAQGLLGAVLKYAVTVWVLSCFTACNSPLTTPREYPFVSLPFMESVDSLVGEAEVIVLAEYLGRNQGQRGPLWGPHDFHVIENVWGWNGKTDAVFYMTTPHDSLVGQKVLLFLKYVSNPQNGCPPGWSTFDAIGRTGLWCTNELLMPAQFSEEDARWVGARVPDLMEYVVEQRDKNGKTEDAMRR